MIRSSKILRHARGQACSMQLPGICSGNPETTVFAHLNGFGKGMGIKTHDVLGFFSCDQCHQYYDVGHGTKPQMSNDYLLEAVLSAVCKTWVKLIADGVVVVPQDPAPKPRGIKPKAQRGPSRPIQTASNWPPKGTRKIQSRPMRKEA